MRGRAAPLLATAVLLALPAAGCRPALDDRPWLVTALQIVAWKAEPPDAAPGAGVSLQILALDPAGAPDTTATSTSWAWCRTAKPLGDNRVVTSDCLAPAAADAVGNPVQLSVPPDACRLFGPDTPQPAPGAPPARPRDPDATGGYYQPVAIALDGALAVGLQRVICGLPDASLAVARAFQTAYQPNQNPTISGLSFSVDGTPADHAAIATGAPVTIQVAWSADSAETFPVFDRASAALVDQGERLTVSWYVTGGVLDRAASEISDPTVVSATTTWTAPSSPAALEIAVVLRDSRGGSDMARVPLVVN